MRKFLALPIAVLLTTGFLFSFSQTAFAAKHTKHAKHVSRTAHASKSAHASKAAKAGKASKAEKASGPEQKLYKDATAKLAKLEKDKKKRKLRTSWEACIAEFDKLIKKYPKSPYAGYALFSKGDAYSRMYRFSTLQSDLDKAADIYEEFVDKYPDNEYADEALQRLAGIYKNEGDDDSAARCYRKIAGEYPKSPYAKSAKAKVKSLPKTKAQAVKAEAKDTPKAEAASKPLVDVAGLSKVTEIRHWSNGGYTRVVIDLGGPVTFVAKRLRNPDRLFFDLKKASLNSTLKDSSIAINDGILKYVRASQNDAETVRVVLDLESIATYRTLMLPDPQRLVIDVTGKDAPAKTAGSGRVITVGPFKEEKAASAAPAAPAAQTTVPVVPAATTTPAVATTPPAPVTPPAPKGVVEVTPLPPVKPTAPAQAALPKPVAPAIKPAVPATLSLAQQLGLCVGTIVIDPGHGGKDTGAIGQDGLYEKDVVLDIGLRLKEILEREVGCKVVMTRDRDVFIDLDARPGCAVQHDADLFVSIHANASPNSKATGIETYLLNLTKDRNIMEVAARENMTTLKNMGDLDVILKDLILDNKRDESLRLAHAVQESMVGELRQANKGAHDKGVKQGPFLVLYGASMPSILTEVGFISNKKEEEHLADPEYREKIADAIFDGIKDYISSTKVAAYKPVK